MIKATGRTTDGTPVLLLGLSGENVTRLAAGELILISPATMQAMGLPAIEVLVCYGRTELDIMNDLGGGRGARHGKARALTPP